MLSPEEEKAIRLAGELYTFIVNNIIDHGATRNEDIAELRSSIHHIQHSIMAQSIARLEPSKYRLLGSTINVNS